MLMNPLGWALAGLVWGYALLFFLFNDKVKVIVCKALHHNNSSLNRESALKQAQELTETKR